MNEMLKLKEYGWLIAGLLLGLGFALAAHWIFDGGWPSNPTSMADLIEPEQELGALGPIKLKWLNARPYSPTAVDFTIDATIGVRLAFEGEILSLTPVKPLAAGAHVLRFFPAEGEVVEWPFTVRQPEPLYSQETAGQRQLYRWRDGNPLLLSGDHLLTDYATTLQGEFIAYAAANEQGGTDLWRVDRAGRSRQLIASCGQDRCDQLAWSPDGTRLAFSRSPANQPDQPRIWTVDADGQGAAALFQDESRLGVDPVWSPDGRRLAFYDPMVSGVRLLDLDTVREEVVPTRAGVSGAWSADGQRLYLPLLVFLGEEPTTHLYELRVEDRELILLLGEQGGWRQVGEPALGLAGDWLALAGQHGSTAATLNLWLVDLENGQPRQLVAGNRFSYGGPSWDATGQHLLFQRFPLGQQGASPDLMLWSAGRGDPLLLVEGAGSAEWLH